MNRLFTSFRRQLRLLPVRNVCLVCSLWLLGNSLYGQSTTVNYTPSTVDIANPERGIYHFTETHSNAYSPLNTTTLTNFRTNENITMIIRMFYLEDFSSAPISANYLNQLQSDFNSMRNAGVKCILRFAYTAETIGWPPASPYGDANKAWMLSHIAQLEPYIQNNSDVIAVVQAGFIGIWGEWYYTTSFGDPLNGNPTAANYVDRKDIMDRLLMAVPADRMIQMRTPYYKYRLYRANVLTPLNAAEAFNGSAVARIGHHNDCYLASADDFGTYVNTATEYNFLASDTRYVPMGGETCQLNAPRTDCTGDALNEFSKFHWSFINRDYINTVWNAWTAQGCSTDIKKNLGYRIQLNSGTYSTAVKPGSSINIALNLTNTGWASMYNPRLLEFVLINTSDGTVCKATTNEEPRKWAAGGTVNLTYEIGIPANYPNGTYKLLLSLPDPKTSLYEKAAYSVRLANDNTTWDNVKGYNYLGFDLTVNNALSTPAYTGASWFSTCYGALPLEWLDFSAVQQAHKTQLIWHTAQEIGTAYFEIQKSNDGYSFTTVGKVNALGSSAINTYTFDDVWSTKGQTYYRIVQYDQDGKFTTSKIVSTYEAQQHQLYAAPNPFTEEVKLFLEGFEEEQVLLQVQDVNGKMVYSQQVEKGTRSLVIGNTFVPGVYVVTASTALHVEYVKIVKTGE